MFVAGCFTGAVGSAVSNPADVFKTMQMANQHAAPPLSELVQRLYSEEGIKGRAQ